METPTQITLEELLYFGSVEVRFKSVAGSLHNCISYREERNEELEKIAANRAKPIFYEKEEKFLIIPAVPAIDLSYRQSMSILYAFAHFEAMNLFQFLLCCTRRFSRPLTGLSSATRVACALR
jgi:hypothetical protein